MTTSGLNQPKGVSVEEYLFNEARAEYKSEYHNSIVVPVHRTVNEHGEIVILGGAQPAHNLLTGKLMALMGLCLKDTDYSVYAFGQLIYLPACERFLYPDVSVVYQKPEYLISPRGLDALLNPSVIIEVLSEGTEGYDRGKKFEYYRTLPSLERYVLADSLRRGIEVFTKQDEKHWLITFASKPDDKVKIGSCEFTVGEIYRKVFLE